MKKSWKLKFLVVLILSMQAVNSFGQPDYPWLRNGDQLYKEGQYTDAETMYRKALEEKQKPTSSYNLGNTIYEQNRLDEAAEAYKKVIAGSSDAQLKSNAYFNLGNSYFQQKKFGESINAYKEALKLQPNDDEAKKNLMLAMRQLQQQQQQQQQQQNQDQQQQQKQDQQQNQQQDQKDQQQQQDQQQNQQQQRQEKEKDSKQNQREQVSKDEAREILKAIEREDQRVQEKLKKTTGSKGTNGKDW